VTSPDGGGQAPIPQGSGERAARPGVRATSPDASGQAPIPLTAPGRDALSAAALVIGLLLMALQLWLLTVALELFLSGKGASVWPLALISGLIFAGGLGMLWLLRRRPAIRRGLPNVPTTELI
jgi:uncharacterized protein DUF6755